MWLVGKVLLFVLITHSYTQVIPSAHLPRGWERQCEHSLIVAKTARSESQCAQLCRSATDCCSAVLDSVHQTCSLLRSEPARVIFSVNDPDYCQSKCATDLLVPAQILNNIATSATTKTIPITTATTTMITTVTSTAEKLITTTPIATTTPTAITTTTALTTGATSVTTATTITTAIRTSTTRTTTATTSTIATAITTYQTSVTTATTIRTAITASTILSASEVTTGLHSGSSQPVPNDCSEVLVLNPAAQSGPYLINIGGAETQVYCNMSTHGYTGILRRFDGSVDFNKSYSELQSMVGSAQTEYWLGLDNIHKLTSSGNWELLVELVDHSTSSFAKYQSFKVGDRSSNYRLGVSGFDPSSTAGNSMTNSNGYGFTTYDHDVDVYGKNCARLYKGAWWFKACHHTNPLGRYAYTPVNQGAMSTYADFMCWRFLPGGVNGHYRALKKIAFYIRKN